MSAKSPPTDPSEDCNELSTQNGGATAPVTESGASVSMRDEALKTTSPSDRVPTTGNAAAAVNETNASQVSRIKGNESLKDKIERCNFDSSESINEVFPPYKGKGTNDVPPELLFFCQSDAAKARIVQGWRNYSENQQLQKISKIVETRQREERAAEAARAALDSEESPPEEEEGRGKRKRKKSVKLLQQEKDEEEKEQAKAGNAPPKKKKRRPNKERTPAQKDLSAVKKKSREQRRNTKRREDAKKAREAAAAKKATSEREQRLAKNVSNSHRCIVYSFVLSLSYQNLIIFICLTRLSLDHSSSPMQPLLLLCLTLLYNLPRITGALRTLSLPTQPR